MFIGETCNCCTGCREQAVLCEKSTSDRHSDGAEVFHFWNGRHKGCKSESIILYLTELFWRWLMDALWFFLFILSRKNVVECSKVEFIDFLRYDYCIIYFEAETTYRVALADTVQRTSSARLFPHSQLHCSAARQSHSHDIWGLNYTQLRTHILYNPILHILTIMQTIL